MRRQIALEDDAPRGLFVTNTASIEPMRGGAQLCLLGAKDRAYMLWQLPKPVDPRNN